MLHSLRSRLALVIALITVAASCVVAMSWSLATGLIDRFDAAAVEVVAETDFNLQLAGSLIRAEEATERYAAGDRGALREVVAVADGLLAALDAGAEGVEFEPGPEADLRSSAAARMTLARRLAQHAPPAGTPAAGAVRSRLDDLLRHTEQDFSGLTRANTAEVAEQLEGADAARVRLAAQIGAAVALLIGLFLALAATVQRNVLRPLRSFRLRVERLRRGEFEAEGLLRGPTEIVMLVQSFDSMAGELSEAQARLRFQALHDELTGLGNRHRLVEQLALLQADGREATVVFIDLDDFKTVNDSLGHGAGDALLADLAERLRRTVRADDVPVRLGGDEFAVLLVDTTPEDADALSQRLLEVLKAPVQIAGFEVASTASIGVASSASAGYEALMRNADMAMYAAKTAGKGRVATFHDGLHTDALARLGLAAELRRAYEQGEFRLHYQPIVRSGPEGTGVSHVEALLRWEHPERGLLAPGAFLPVLEELPLMTQVGGWVLQQALRDLAVLRADQPELGVAVNITAPQLRSSGFAEEVAAALSAAALPPSALVLELTERDAMDDEAQARQLQALRALGVSLALDDFGTGYSSLAALRWLPVDVLKIDRSFVGRMENGEQDRTVVQATIAMAHALGLVIVAEGVESEAQDRYLDALGCDLQQGYLHARPMPADEVLRWVRKCVRSPLLVA
ncbi:MAG: EAL domain-containing protein [Actinomycetota bacterium]|nr:EAL domain-containing protein [Actinomycetota bacterium]